MVFPKDAFGAVTQTANSRNMWWVGDDDTDRRNLIAVQLCGEEDDRASEVGDADDLHHQQHQAQYWFGRVDNAQLHPDMLDDGHCFSCSGATAAWNDRTRVAVAVCAYCGSGARTASPPMRNCAMLTKSAEIESIRARPSEQFEGVIWRFRSGGQWREMPAEFGPWQTVYDAFARRRDAGMFAALMNGMIAEAAARGQADLSLVSVDSTVTRAHHDAAGMVVDPAVLAALERAAATEKGRPIPDKPR